MIIDVECLILEIEKLKARMYLENHLQKFYG